MIEPLLLSTTRITTFINNQSLTNASGFFFERGKKLFLVTSKHVLIDEPTKHFPNRIEIEIHIDQTNLAHSTGFSIPLYQNGLSVWRQGEDSAGDIDVAVVELERDALPDTTFYKAFTLDHLPDSYEEIDIGSTMLVVGFPLGFHDTLHHLPVVRQAINASSFGLRFQGKGYFLTDARTHRGTSGAAVVLQAKREQKDNGLPWTLLGVHSARLDVGTREVDIDEALGLNCTWFADILTTLTK